VVLAAVFALPGAAALTPGRNAVTVRGQQQDIYYFPASAKPPRGKILFTPGDGGWRGAAITIANQIAAWGYDVYGWDTKRYLRSFTSDTAVLSEADVARDFHAVASTLAGVDPVLLVGWSQGAAMSVLAAASARGERPVFAGIVAIGLPETGVLGWRWKDDLTYVTKKEPDEPKFRTAKYVSEVAPLPFCIVQAGNDGYTPVATLDALYAGARPPRRLMVVPGASHAFSGHESEFYSRLREGLEWTLTARPSN
jgi:pimeloyl-ACP methyl ester carboxylesterase